MKHALSTLVPLSASLALAAIALAARAEESAGATPDAAHHAYVKPNIVHEPYGEVKLVVPLTSDDKGVQRMKLRNIANGLKAADQWQGRFSVKVVLYAKGITLLRDPDEPMRKQLDALRSRGVQFVVCGNTLAEQDVDFHSLYHVTDADIVPSGFAEVAYLQAHQGYVVDPSN